MKRIFFFLLINIVLFSSQASQLSMICEQKKLSEEKQKLINDALIEATYAQDHLLMAILLANGADSNVRNQRGFPLILHPARIGDEIMLDLLLDNNAEIDAQNNDKHSALFSAIFHDHLKIVKRLLDAGASPELRDYKEVSAEEYAQRNSSTMYQIFVDFRKKK